MLTREDVLVIAALLALATIVALLDPPSAGEALTWSVNP